MYIWIYYDFPTQRMPYVGTHAGWINSHNVEEIKTVEAQMGGMMKGLSMHRQSTLWELAFHVNLVQNNEMASPPPHD